MTSGKSVSARPLTSSLGRALRSHPYALATLATAAALIVCAVVNRRLAKKAEQEAPPVGAFVRVDGVRLHYVEQGEGEPLVLLHGNGSMLQDFACSGLLDTASQSHRVVAFDRPGYGYSDRPRSK